MSQTDWGTLTGGLSETQVLRGPTVGTTPPNGGGAHVFGFRSAERDVGAAGLYCLQENFSPTPAMKGGRISGALKRSTVGSSSGFAPFLFFAAQGAAVSSPAYLLGLSDETASRIELRKGAIAEGLPVPAEGTPNVAPHVLMRSADAIAADTWVHLRLDVIVQGSGDVILQVFKNDLSLHTVTNPVWQVVPGMTGGLSFTGFVDDNLGVNTGSAPFTSGMVGFGARFEQANRVVYFDHLQVERQL